MPTADALRTGWDSAVPPPRIYFNVRKRLRARERVKLTATGRYSPIRYPGGKGKLARFIKMVVRVNDLSDGRYVEPYAGGAGIAWELLISGVVRRVSVNDISRPVFSFWHSVLNETEELCRLVQDCRVTVEEWDSQKAIYRRWGDGSDLQLGFAFFFLNRTNVSGVLNGGIIGGRKQQGKWNIEARFNRSELISRIEKIAMLRSRVELTQMDAVEFLVENAHRFLEGTLIYLDPPYFMKGRFLYHDAYNMEDHLGLAKVLRGLSELQWIASYDDVNKIHELYIEARWLQYSLNHSLRKMSRGREVMFFSPRLLVPPLPEPFAIIDGELGERVRDVVEREIPN